MATTPITSDNAAVTQTSKSKEQGLSQPTGNERSMYVSLPNDVPKDKHDIVWQVKQLHKPEGSNVNAVDIFLFVKSILEPAPASQTEAAALQDTPSSIYDYLPEFSDMPIIAGNVASEIACKVVNEVDSHNTTLSVLNILQKFSWASKVALTVATFVLTFGDSGLNMTAESRVNVDKSPLFNEDEFKPTNNLINAMVDATSCIVDFENLSTSFFTSDYPKIKNANTDFLVAVYLIIKAVVVATAHNITMSSRGVGFATLKSMELFDWATKLKSISDDLKNMLPELKKLLEADPDMEAYNLVKETVIKENHNDNMEVLNALISDNDDMPQLYDCRAHERLRLHTLKGETVLLLISDLDIPTYPIQFLKYIASPIDWYKVVWIPVDQTEATEDSKFESQRDKMPWYSVHHPRMIKNPVIKFLKKEWEFKGDPIVVVLDPRGNVLHQNAMHMIYIWDSRAAPFTKSREETLWKEEHDLALDLLFGDYFGERLFLNFQSKKMARLNMSRPTIIIMHGVDNKDWIQSFESAVDEVDQWGVTMLINHVGRNGENYVELRWQHKGLTQVLKVEECYFWVRIESMISSLRNQTNVGDHAFVILQQLQRLLHYEKSNVDWAIVANSYGKIKVLGHAGVALSTLQEFEHWKEKMFDGSEEGFLEEFESHYRELYRQKFPYQRIEFPAPAKPTKTMLCPDCHAQMESYNTFLCYHPS